MIAALTAGSAVCCFGVAYATHMILPVKPVTPAEILKNQSTLNTLNFLTKDELKTRSIQERSAAYTSSRANLLDVLLVTADKPTLNQAYVVIAKKIETFPPESEERGQYEFLRKAADDHLNGFVPPKPTDGQPNQLVQESQKLIASIPFPTPAPAPTPTPPASAPSSRKVFPPTIPRAAPTPTPAPTPIPTPPLPPASSRNLGFSPVRARPSATSTPTGGRRRRSSVSE